MKIKIHPSQAKGCVIAPPSKSIAHRALIAAGLAEGTSTIRNIEYSEDILATIDCLKALGANVEALDNTVKVSGAVKDSAPIFPFNCRESGSTLRFFLPIAATSGKKAIFYGAKRLLERPLTVYETLFSENGITFEKNDDHIVVNGTLTSGNYTVKGDISSQFVTGLLFALSRGTSNSTLNLTDPIESRSYIDLTLDTLRSFGIRAEWLSQNTIFIEGNARYLPCDYTVEGDWSNAAFTKALELLGDEVTTIGLNENSRQGDKVILSYFAALKNGTPTLSLADCPDTAPILMTMAALLNGATFTDTARLAIKESDRGRAMAEELAKCGAILRVEENRITVEKSALHAPREALSGHNDHRIVMSLSILLTRLGGVIEGAEAINKSYPSFFEMLASLNVKLEKE